MANKENLTGSVINGKKIVGVAGIANDGYHTIYKVECPKCKNIYTSPKSNLLRTKTCFKCCPRTQKGKEHNRWKGQTVISLDYFNSLKRNAKTRNIPFLVSITFLEKLYFDQEKKCALTNIDIDFKTKTASLDRIDNTRGYTTDNVQWLHKEVNLIKNNRCQQDFINYCIKTHQYTHQSKPLGLIPLTKLCTHKNFKGHGYIPKDFYTSLKKNADKRNLKFSITIKDLNDLFIYQSGKCFLTGADLFFKKHYKNGPFKKLGNASLDRIDNNNGYTKDNIQWVDKNINTIKYKLSQERFLEICKYITKKFTTTVAISGYFQIIHSGHINYITESRKLGGYLIAIINSDKQAALKSTPSVVDEKSREYIISNIKGVDETCIAIDSDGTVSKTLEFLKPDIFCNGGDRTPNSTESKETLICKKHKIKMIYDVGGKKSDSSSGILHRAHKILLEK